MIQFITPSTGGKFRQFLCTSASVLGIGVVAFPSIIHAAGADGTYRVTGGKGSLKAGGKTREIPKSLFKEITKGQSAAMVVKDQKLKINRNMSAAFFKALANESGVTVRPKVTGPSSITLEPTGNYFKGRTSSPIITKLSGTEDGEKFSVTVKTDVDAVARGNTLTLTTRFSASDGSDEINGTIILTGVQPAPRR